MDLDDDRALFVGGNHPFYVVVPQGGAKDLQADYVYVMGLNACDAAVFDLKQADDDQFYIAWQLDYPSMSNSQ